MIVIELTQKTEIVVIMFPSVLPHNLNYLQLAKQVLVSMLYLTVGMLQSIHHLGVLQNYKNEMRLLCIYLERNIYLDQLERIQFFHL